MPLNATVLTDLIESKFPALEEADARAERRKAILAIAEAVVEHIKAAAEISAPVLPGLIAPPGTAGGPVTGNIVTGPGAID